MTSTRSQIDRLIDGDMEGVGVKFTWDHDGSTGDPIRDIEAAAGGMYKYEPLDRLSVNLPRPESWSFDSSVARTLRLELDSILTPTDERCLAQVVMAAKKFGYQLQLVATKRFKLPPMLHLRPVQAHQEMTGGELTISGGDALLALAAPADEPVCGKCGDTRPMKLMQATTSKKTFVCRTCKQMLTVKQKLNPFRNTL